MKKEPLRYLQNAKEILKKAPVEDNRYADIKYVQEACGIAYLAILKAIDGCLLNKEVSKKELPRSVDTYRKALQKYLAVHDGKLLRDFEALYDQLHIAGYYRGLLHDIDAIKGIFKAAKAFIERLK